MTRERAFNGPIEIVDTGNCLTGSIATIYSHLSSKFEVSAEALENALIETNDVYLTNLIHLLEQVELGDIKYDILCFEYIKRRAVEVLVELLNAKTLCEITVKGTPWITEVLSEEDPYPNDELHSVVILGYYQPSETSDSTWFYVVDTYSMKVVFTSWKKLSSTIYVEEDNAFTVGIYGKSLNKARSLIKSYSVKEELSDPAVQAAILSRIPKKKPKAKLKSLLKTRKSTLRRQS